MKVEAAISEPTARAVRRAPAEGERAFARTLAEATSAPAETKAEEPTDDPEAREPRESELPPPEATDAVVLQASVAAEDVLIAFREMLPFASGEGAAAAAEGGSGDGAGNAGRVRDAAAAGGMEKVAASTSVIANAPTAPEPAVARSEKATSTEAPTPTEASPTTEASTSPSTSTSTPTSEPIARDVHERVRERETPVDAAAAPDLSPMPTTPSAARSEDVVAPKLEKTPEIAAEQRETAHVSLLTVKLATHAEIVDPELGRIRIDAASRDGRVDLSVTADSTQTVAALQAIEPALRADFAKDAVAFGSYRAEMEARSDGNRSHHGGGGDAADGRDRDSASRANDVPMAVATRRPARVRIVL